MKVRKGFTLVELLIVMATITALLAIFVPVAKGAMRKAKATRIGVIMRNVEQAATQYLMTYLPEPTSGSILDVATLVDKGFLNNNDLFEKNKIRLWVYVPGGQYEIRVGYYHGGHDEDFINMIYATLKNTYSKIATGTSYITIVSTGTMFW